MIFERAGDAARKQVAVDREGGARGDLVHIGLAHDDRTEGAHFAVEQADGIAVAVVATETVRAHHFGERVALMRRGHVAAPAHFGQADAKASFGKLPRRFGSGEAAADDVNVVFRHLPYPLTCDQFAAQ